MGGNRAQQADVRFVCVGEGPRKAEFAARVAELGLSNVQLLDASDELVGGVGHAGGDGGIGHVDAPR